MGRIENLYVCMLENGELKKMFSKMSGDWEKDKKRFTEEQIKMEKILGLDVTEED